MNEYDDLPDFGDPISEEVADLDPESAAPRYVTREDFDASQQALLDSIKGMLKPEPVAPPAASAPLTREQEMAEFATGKATYNMNESFKGMHMKNLLDATCDGLSPAARQKMSDYLGQFTGNQLANMQSMPRDFEAMSRAAKGFEFEFGPHNRVQAPRSGGSGTIQPDVSASEADQAASELRRALAGKRLPNGQPIPPEFFKQAGTRMANKVK